MIKVSVLYPNTTGCRFDMDYYLSKHVPPNYTGIQPTLQISEVKL